MLRVTQRGLKGLVLLRLAGWVTCGLLGGSSAYVVYSRHVVVTAGTWWWQVLPVERGRGLNQVGLEAAEERLRLGDWVHIFPEGTRSPTGHMGPIRRGVGRLVASCSEPPLGVPISESSSILRALRLQQSMRLYLGLQSDARSFESN